MAIEQATSPNEPGSVESPILDLTVKYKLSKGWEHFMVSSYSGLVRSRYDAEGKTDILLSGLNVSGSILLKNKIDSPIKSSTDLVSTGIEEELLPH